MSIDIPNLEIIIRSLVEQELIAEPCEPIKSGKEASVFRCRGHADSPHRQLALKVYRPRGRRSFKNDSLYREGSMIYRVGGGNTRAARALRAGTRFGRQVQEHTWGAREWEVLQVLYAAGIPVPEPVYMAEGAIVMELFTCQDGSVAAPLVSAHLQPAAAMALFESVCDDVEHMLWLDLLHGDLSPYNILWNGEQYRIIDFPQAVDPRFNRSALRLLMRDVENVGRFCARFADIPDPAHAAMAMWARFQRGERL